MPSFIEIKWETPQDAVIRHWEEKERLDRELGELTEQGQFHSKRGKQINDRLCVLEDMFTARDGSGLGPAKRAIPVTGTFTFAPGMIGQIRRELRKYTRVNLTNYR